MWFPYSSASWSCGIILVKLCSYTIWQKSINVSACKYHSNECGTHGMYTFNKYKSHVVKTTIAWISTRQDMCCFSDAMIALYENDYKAHSKTAAQHTINQRSKWYKIPSNRKLNFEFYCPVVYVCNNFLTILPYYSCNYMFCRFENYSIHTLRVWNSVVLYAFHVFIWFYA